MDQPVKDATDVVGAVDPIVAPARNTRSAQRRRAAAPTVPSVAAREPEPMPQPAPEPMIEPVTEPVTGPKPEIEAVEASPEPEPAPIDPSPPTPVSAEPAFTPPAAVAAETVTEEIVMDTVNTAETVKNTADKMVDQGQAMTADMSGRAKEAMEKGSKMAEELGTFSKGNLEALVESSKIATKGMEAIAQEAAEFSRKSFESATAAMKTLASTRSPTEFMKLQSDYSRSMFDMMVAETTKSTEMMMKLASEIAQPISNRVAMAAEKMKITG